jgi:glycosyltransferase involved in cell wall biosynthesis
MIPTYNPQANYLEQVLHSVLVQDVGPAEMQIEVVDDCSPKVDVVSLVRKIAADRVRVFRGPVNKGLAGCWNTCIDRSHGRWVHILHQDDFILPGFYQTLANSAERHPEVGLLATRSFFIDGENVIVGVTERLHLLEDGGQRVNDFFYSTPIQCSAVVVKRTCYECHGGFRSDLSFTLDCEMWARIIGSAGGLITSEVLSCYRMSDINETARLIRTSEGLCDLERLNQLFAERYSEFDSKIATQRVCSMALNHADRFYKKGDFKAGKANMDYWKINAPFSLRLRRFARNITQGILE